MGREEKAVKRIEGESIRIVEQRVHYLISGIQNKIFECIRKTLNASFVKKNDVVF